MIKALVRLRGCAGWSAPLLFAIKKSQGFSCICPYDVEAKASWPLSGYAPSIVENLLQTDQQFVGEWLIDNKLSLHLGKAASSLFGSKSRLRTRQ